jgi:hypothetical protein
LIKFSTRQTTRKSTLIASAGVARDIPTLRHVVQRVCAKRVFVGG